MTRHRRSKTVSVVLILSCLILTLAPLAGQSSDENETKINKARSYFEKGNFHRALNYLNAILQENDRHPEALYLRGKINLVRGRFQNAKQDAKTLVQDTTTPWKGHLLLGKIHLRRGKRKKSLEQLNRVLKLKPSNLEARKLRGLIYWRNNRYKKSRNDFDEIPLNQINNPTVLVAMAQTYYCTEDQDRAKQIAEKGLELLPGDRELRRIIAFQKRGISPSVETKIEEAELHYQEGKQEKAIKTLDVLIKNHPDLPRLYTIRGNFYFGKKALKKAEKDARKARKLDSELPEAPYLLGNIYWHRKDYEKAKTWFDRTYKLNKHIRNISVLLGISLVKTKHYDRAIKILSAMQLQILQYPKAVVALTRAFLKKQMLIPARRLLKQTSTKSSELKKLHEELKKRIKHRAKTEKGTYRNGIYRNSIVGFRVDVPETWTYTSNAYSALLKAVFFSPEHGDRVMVTSRIAPPGYQNPNLDKADGRKKFRSFIVKDLQRRNPGFDFVRDRKWKSKGRKWYRALFEKKHKNRAKLRMHIFGLVHKKRILIVHYVSERPENKHRKSMRNFMERFVIMK